MEYEDLISVLKARFEKNMNRHIGLEWVEVEKRLKTNTQKLWTLNEMEKTGGEPDVVDYGSVKILPPEGSSIT